MRVLTGIQPSGQLHLGNYFGAMKPVIEMQASGEVYLFIANYHALTTVDDPVLLKKTTEDVALDFLACGLDPDRGLRAVLVEDAAVDEVRRLEFLWVERRGFDLLQLDEGVDRLLVEDVARPEEECVESDHRRHVDRLAEADDGAGGRGDVLVPDHDAGISGYETLAPGRTEYQQDAVDWLDRGIVDFIVPGIHRRTPERASEFRDLWTDLQERTPNYQSAS